MLTKLIGSRINFVLESSDDALCHLAITRACEVHGLPSHVCVTPEDEPNPWSRVCKVGEKCVDAGVLFALNGSTIIGQHIKDGAKSSFWQKAMPILFESVCRKYWPQMEGTSGKDFDAVLNGCGWISNASIAMSRRTLDTG
jgi:hypothetical protein